MSKNHSKITVRNWMYRGFTGILCLVLLLGLLPGTALFAAAEEETEEVVEEVTENWSTPYMNQLVGWGVMRGDIDGNLYPERNITRAEFVTMMNRAYGYDETGGNPFTDVFTQDWYYDDIDIAYNVGYFSGTSPTTATPNGNLSREQATVLLARNMMLQGTSGEALGFSDSRELSEWSRGLVGAAAETGVINGYTDGSFRPQNDISRGEVAAMLSRAVGTLIDQPGSQSLGGVYGNLTINSSNVSLRDTTIVGNLYLTGGIGLGDVLLENVDVYGEIIVAGAGESNSSQSSVVLRNVTANELIVDNISNQFVTVRAEGDTLIPKTSVRTNAYIEDTTDNSHGLSYIELDGEQGTQLQLAGNIKEVKNLTPLSSLEIVQGSAAKVTADEHATGSVVRIDAGARVNELNLDVGASVSGDGDIGTMNVGAAGTNVGILPDNITVRPGITSNITGTTMNNVTAAESSSDPRLLSGYPAVRNVAPNSATLVFSTNKAGTVYWAISALADGSVSEDDLINNPVYGGNIFRSGTINAANSKTEYTAQVAGLTVNGSYYVTAMLVDSRGNHSPLKVTAFSTPDNTTPAFTAGYPVMTRTTTKNAQVTVMTNKSCQMFYALLPRGSSTPSVQEFKSGAVSGNLGYGVVDVVKNNTQPVNVNSVQLEELTNYTLYLWLNDYDNARSSGVRAINFSTPDETPPVVTDIMQIDSKPTYVDVNFTLNEPGTLYWAVVVEGNDTFMNYEMNTTEAKIKVRSGSGALRSGSVRAARADNATLLRVQNLVSSVTGTTSYDLYYVAIDNYNNYAETVGKINVRTLDTDAPTVRQEFTKYNDDDKDKPLADTDIRLVFSESVQGGADGKRVFVSLYNEVAEAVRKDGAQSQSAINAREALGNALSQHIKMYPVPTTNNQEVTVRDKDNQDSSDLDWTIDYRFATVAMEEGEMVITFPTVEESGEPASALNLDSGATYYFRVEGIYDNALTPNIMGAKNLDPFRTVFARVELREVDNNETMLRGTVYDTDGETPIVFENNDENTPQRIDFNFIVDPISVDRVDKNMCWDMLIWTDTTMQYTLYSREISTNENAPWVKVGQSDDLTVHSSDGFVFRSLKRWFPSWTQMPDYEELYKLSGKKFEYAIHIDKLGDSTDFTSWNNTVSFRISIVAGTSAQLRNLSQGGLTKHYDEALADGVAYIETPSPFQKRRMFTDSKAPNISEGWPAIDVADVSATINVMLDRPGTIYYIVFPLSRLTDSSNGAIEKPTNANIDDIFGYTSSVRVTGGHLYDTDGNWVKSMDNFKVADVPSLEIISKDDDEDQDDDETAYVYKPETPTVRDVIGGNFTNTPNVIMGDLVITNANAAGVIELGKDNNKLRPNTVYFICMATRGTSAIYPEYVNCYRFVTTELQRPVIDLENNHNGGVVVSVDRTTSLNYFMVQTGKEDDRFRADFFGDDGAATTRVDATSYKALAQYDFEGKGEKMSVLEAMSTRCNKAGTSDYVGSVFDIFASESTKGVFAALIRTQGSNTAQGVASNSLNCTVSGANIINYNIPNINVNVDYTLFTVGSSMESSQSSGDSFRATYPVSKKDSVAPQITSAVINKDEDKTNDKTFTGNLMLIFNEPLYYKDMSTLSQRILPLDTCTGTKEHGVQVSQTYVALGSIALYNNSSTAKVKTENNHGYYKDEKDNNRVEVRTIVIEFTNASMGATVTIDGGLCDVEGNNHTKIVDKEEVPMPLTVTLSKRTENGETVYYCDITPEWYPPGTAY